MKKIVVVLVLCGLFAFGFTDDDLYNVKKIEESITVPEPEVIVRDQYITLKLKEAETNLSKTGEPVLPVLTRTFILPFGTKIEDLNVSFSEEGVINLSKKIQPGPQPRSKIDLRAPKEIQRKNEIYEGDGLYPSEKFTCSARAGIKDKKRVIFLKIHIYPMRYSPGRDAVYFCENINVKVI